ncbi:expressed unknown protein [Seminavis robusta]|uniref:DUF7495 domain-containing protein n=1 Tax=Seminavis robusta TaxID=568900 RepID=A0A9N8E2I0_9STRA|nr:expressed unknown protein [Seminavis robusta]|eukprot:Sro584_g170740.1 n/a (1800) ;mRNA; f:1553-7297
MIFPTTSKAILLWAALLGSGHALDTAESAIGVPSPEAQPAIPKPELPGALGQIQAKTQLLRKTSIEKQNLRQRTETAVEAEKTLKTVRDQLDALDVGGFEVFEKARDNTKEALDAGLREVGAVVELMHKAEMGSSEIADMIAEYKLGRRTSRRNRRNLATDAEDEFSDFKYHSKPPNMDEGGSSFHQQHQKKTRAKYKVFFERDQSAANMHQKISKMHDAVLSGDHTHLHKVLRTHHKKADRYNSANSSGRRLKKVNTFNEDPLEHAKGKQCKILTNCARMMSFYDLFIFVYSDDIDVKGGKIDKDIIHFDDWDLHKKYKQVNLLSRKIWKRHKHAEDKLLAYGLDEDCDNLLQLFHRNIEQGDVPHWEGATVSQVCLAEGTAEFVPLGEISKAVGLKITSKILEEQMNCAWDLYNSKNRTEDERYRREPFIFADEKQHSKTDRLTIDDLLIPTGINYDIRDEFGQIKADDERNSHKRFYEYEAYHSPDLRGLPAKEKQDAIEDVFKKVQDGFDLALGEKQSVGFVCGVKQGITEFNQPFPGHCCLDAPYENQGDDWGRKKSCHAECKNPGPFLSGLSEEACSAHGGFWCQSPANCEVLQECVDDQIAKAEQNGFLPYAAFLKGGLIKNPHDAHDCGRSREYFGFDETYNNDADVCENVIQLRNTRNFEDLDNFFNQGSKGSDKEENKAIPSASIDKKAFTLFLKEPTRDRSGTEPVTQGGAWSATNFALEQASAVVNLILDSTSDFECPDDGWGIIYTICGAIKNILMPILAIVLSLLEIVLAISEFTMSELCEPSAIDHLEVYENTDAIFANMEVTFKYLDHIYNTVTSNQGQIAKANTKTGDILQERMDRIDETLAYIVDKLDAMPEPAVTHRPTPVPTKPPTSAPTLTPGNTHAPSSSPSVAPSAEDFCDEIMTIDSIVDSDWYFEEWGCSEVNPCMAKYDAENFTLAMGASVGDSKGWQTLNKAETRRLLCGLPFSAVWEGEEEVEKTLHLKDGSIEVVEEGIVFSRCKAIYSLEDIHKSDWIQEEWGCPVNHPCIEAEVDQDGRLWMGNPVGHSGFGPGKEFGRFRHLHTVSEAETHRLLCGRPAEAMISSVSSKVAPKGRGLSGLNSATDFTRKALDGMEVDTIKEELDDSEIEDMISQAIKMKDSDTLDIGEMEMTRACTEIYTLGDVVDSDWFLKAFGCNSDSPCTAHADDDGILWIGKENEKGADYGGKGWKHDRWHFFRTSSPADTRNLLCGKKAEINRNFEINYIVVNDKKVVGGYPFLQGAKDKLNSIKDGQRLIAAVKEGKVVRDPHIIDGQEQKTKNGFNKFWWGWPQINQMMDVAERYYENEVHYRFLVIEGTNVKGKYAKLDDAKAKLKTIKNGNRMIAEVKETKVLENPHRIAGQAQEPDLGFNKYWGGWNDIKKMVEAAKSYVKIRNPRIVKFTGDSIAEITEEGKYGFTFERGCEPIYSVDDITKHQWTWKDWDEGRGLTSRLDDKGRLWMGRPGKGFGKDSYGPDKFYGKWFVWSTINSDETRKLLCGLPATIDFDNGEGQFTMTMESGNKMMNSRGGGQFFYRTKHIASVPTLKMYGPDEGTGAVKNWNEAVGFCKSKGRELATYDQICDKSGKPFGGVKNGNQWTPYIDTKNGFASIGNTGWAKHDACIKHDAKEAYGDGPSWGMDNKKEAFESNYILCAKADLQWFSPSDGTEIITNWEDGVKFCESKEMVLASAMEYCFAGKLFGGRKPGHNWAPFADHENAWVNIGTQDSECKIHRDAYGDPRWGTDTKKQTWEANYVLCKPDQGSGNQSPPN